MYGQSTCITTYFTRVEHSWRVREGQASSHLWIMDDYEYLDSDEDASSNNLDPTTRKQLNGRRNDDVA